MPTADYRRYAAAGISALQRWYSPWTGVWRTSGWWSWANALTTIIDYMSRTGDRSYFWVIGRTFWLARLRNIRFVNRYFDDNGWWALAWLTAYEFTGKASQLATGQRIFDNMVTAWDETCNGGLWWNQDRKYKNAITNELFLAVATRLHQLSPAAERTYLDWALREWDWLQASGMINQVELVNDGLTADCKNNGKPTYTYNQGVILAGLADLHAITGDNAYLRQAEAIADAAMRDLITPPSADRPGILTEPGEADMAGRRGDGSQFKGVFIRNLYYLHSHAPKASYRDFIFRNALSIWQHNRNAEDQFGNFWAGPFDCADASRQSSALDALVAAAALTAPAAS
jgi:predicted alpha-1,6-mannanase (GH76 family)